MVEFKITKGGILLTIKDYKKSSEIVEAVEEKLQQMKDMYLKGDKVSLKIENHHRHVMDIPKIIKVIQSFGLEVSKIIVGEETESTALQSMSVVEEKAAKSGTKIVKRNVRSGQVVIHSGDVVIFGNLHNGAEVMAGGSVIIFGNAEGIVRAGLNEGYTAVVAALHLNPSILQIADKTARINKASKKPSVAHIRAGRIVIEEFNKVKFKEEF